MLSCNVILDKKEALMSPGFGRAPCHVLRVLSIFPQLLLFSSFLRIPAIQNMAKAKSCKSPHLRILVSKN
jgi:hypothetical protein